MDGCYFDSKAIADFLHQLQGLVKTKSAVCVYGRPLDGKSTSIRFFLEHLKSVTRSRPQVVELTSHLPSALRSLNRKLCHHSEHYLFDFSGDVHSLSHVKGLSFIKHPEISSRSVDVKRVVDARLQRYSSRHIDFILDYLYKLEYKGFSQLTQRLDVVSSLIESRHLELMSKSQVEDILCDGSGLADALEVIKLVEHIRSSSVMRKRGFDGFQGLLLSAMLVRDLKQKPMAQIASELAIKPTTLASRMKRLKGELELCSYLDSLRA